MTSAVGQASFQRSGGNTAVDSRPLVPEQQFPAGRFSTPHSDVSGFGSGLATGCFDVPELPSGPSKKQITSSEAMGNRPSIWSPYWWINGGPRACCCSESDTNSTFHFATPRDTSVEVERMPFDEEHENNSTEGSDNSREDGSRSASRFQKLVRIFAKKASKGIHCKVIDAHYASALPAVYRIDKRLTQMNIVAEGRGLETILLANIEGVYWASDFAAFCPQASVAALPTDERSRLYMIQHNGGKHTLLIAEKAEDKELFEVCVKVIRMYARRSSRARSPGSEHSIAQSAHYSERPLEGA